jgi:hypothetical protein
MPVQDFAELVAVFRKVVVIQKGRRSVHAAMGEVKRHAGQFKSGRRGMGRSRDRLDGHSADLTFLIAVGICADVKSEAAAFKR